MRTDQITYNLIISRIHPTEGRKELKLCHYGSVSVPRIGDQVPWFFVVSPPKVKSVLWHFHSSKDESRKEIVDEVNIYIELE